MTTPGPPDDTWPQPAAPQTLVPAHESYGPPPPQPPPDRRIGAGMLLALGAVALVGLGFLITYLVLHRNHHSAAPPPTTSPAPPATTSTSSTSSGGTAALVPVPDLRGVQAPHARAALSSVGLHPRQTLVAAAGKPAGSVVSESPQPGARVVKGSQVLLSVARGSSTTTSTSTSTPTSTTATTTGAATTTGQTTTSAPATTAAAPSHPATVAVPDLSGQDESTAVQTLGRAGLLPALAFVPSDDPLGTVEAQAKPSGATVPYHTHVQVNLSTGPGQKPSEDVPNVIGKKLQEAVASLNAAHLRLIYLRYPVSSRSQAGTIVQQSPLGGGQAPQNAQVLVFMAVYQS